MENNKDQMYNNPQNWKLGFIYFNPQDPRIILFKRIKGFGFTFNFAKPLTYVILLLFTSFIILLKNIL